MTGHYLVMDNAPIYSSTDIGKCIHSRGYRYSPALIPLQSMARLRNQLVLIGSWLYASNVPADVLSELMVACKLIRIAPSFISSVVE
ncbi:hypothetical protein DM01DRAFT_197886 [Hesseltinella vesiculosa]|uniref:Tc1-like transposase DDE domain-containing protein n=1 Tax=Hesseltinella vesiculosa TaxID=101127 RepID=A0A1X2GAN6_9FUNG|nr:hypothetical protein DM01DRAFT_197886 [Hesseltinella vesiculosa]